MSIRLRLTLLYSGILALTLVAFGLVLYAAQSQSTLNMLENDLEVNVDRIVVAWTRAWSEMDRRRMHPWMMPPGALERDLSFMNPPFEVRGLRPRDTLRILDANGSPFDLSVNDQSEDLTISPEGLEQLQQGQIWTEIVPGEEGRLLVYNQPVVYNDQVVGIVQAARTLADRDRALSALGITLALSSLLAIIAAFGMGWVLAGVTLQPIHRITQTALSIGRTRDFSSRVQYQGPNDELGRLATAFNDMLGRLQDAYQQVAHSLQVQRDFVADVSHELRTPLTTLRGNLALLGRQPALPQEEKQDVLEDLIGENERLIRLVGDLLTLARADAGRQLRHEPVAVAPLVQEVCRQAQLLGPERTIECVDGSPLMVMADPDALKQVLLILLDNAIRHARGTIRLAVDPLGQQVAVRVQDGGPGMSPELCTRAFDRFYRQDMSRSTPGFGLGLSIAKALAEAQGGTIAVESQVGQGSTFTVTLAQVGEDIDTSAS